jgi:hypothetical protein
MAIEELNAIPTHKKGDDGYYYDEKYVGQLYKYKDKLLYFSEKTYVEFPIKILTELEELVKTNINKIDDNVKNDIDQLSKILDRSEDIQTINLSLDTLKDMIEKMYIKFDTVSDRLTKHDKEIEINQNLNTNNLQKLTDSLDETNVELVEFQRKIETQIKFLNDKLELLSSKVESLDTMTKADIEKVIDEKLSDVYENFKNVSNQLTKSAVQEALKDSKRDQTGKLKMSSLAMLKEVRLRKCA